MEQLLSKKSELNNNFNEILLLLNNIDLKDNSLVDELNNKNKILTQLNNKLINEISEKDKIISMNQKTICDYEKQINLFNKEQEESNKFDMFKAKDKEVHEQNKIITNLQKEIKTLKTLQTHPNKKLVCEVQEIVKETSVKETPVKETSVKETSVKETPVKETPVEEEVEEEVEQDSDEQLDVETITWYKKEYYMLDEGGEKKVFEIEDDDLGKEVGLWVDNKLVRPGKK
jgi:DNA repair exonuclease SbcCD ATPase subunit